jgi:hypothetical protein
MARGHAGFAAGTAIEIYFKAILLARTWSGQGDQASIIWRLHGAYIAVVKLRKALNGREVLLV